MRTSWRAVRWGVAALVVAGSVAFFLLTVRHTPGPLMARVPHEAWYGNWRAGAAFMSLVIRMALHEQRITEIEEALARRQAECRG